MSAVGLKSLATRLFAQPFVQAHIKENIKAPCHWPLWVCVCVWGGGGGGGGVIWWRHMNLAQFFSVAWVAVQNHMIGQACVKKVMIKIDWNHTKH